MCVCVCACVCVFFFFSFLISNLYVNVRNTWIKKYLKKKKKYITNIYTSFKLELSAFTEVVQWIEALTLSSNLFGGSGFESSWSKFFVTFFCCFFFFTVFLTCVVRIASNIMWWNCERFEPRSLFKSRLTLIVQVNVVLNRTVVVDSDWRFDNLCSSDLQNQSEVVSPQLMVLYLVIDLIGQFCRNVIFCLSVKLWCYWLWRLVT